MPNLPLTVDLRRLSTEQLGIAYVDVLRNPGGLPGPDREAIQQEWSRRPKIERLAALRHCRTQAATAAEMLVKVNSSGS